MSAQVPSAAEPEFRRLLPGPGTVTALEQLSALDLGSGAPPERPYTIVNFVASADGRAAFNGRSAALSGSGDRAMFHGLREHVDAVLAGTNTMRTERYGRLVRAPERRERRMQRGLAADPLACLITRSGEVPTDIPLFDDASSRVAVFCPQALGFDDVRAAVQVVELDPGELTMTTMLRRLRSDFDVRSLLCEGGPTVFGALLREQLVDELFLTISPRLAGGGADPPASGGPALAELIALELTWVLEHEHTLFLRYHLAAVH